MKIGYVCTNFNNSAFTRKAVESLVGDAADECRIVVVDNASAAQDVDELKKLQRDYGVVRLILNDENVGYFRGLNLGMHMLRETDPDIEWIVIGNNDLEFPAGFVDAVARNVGRWREYAVISPDVVTVDGQHQNPHVISRISRVRELFYDIYYSNFHVGLLVYKLASCFRSLSARGDEDSWQVARPIYQGHGSCYLLGPRFFAEFNELWAPTFLMGEEFFLSKQLKDAGMQVFYDPALHVVHHWHSTVSNVPSRRRWEFCRDAHREYRKYIKVFR